MSLIIYLRTSLKSSVENKDKSSFRIATNKQESLDEFLIQVELLPSEYNIDDNKLIEITDRKVLSRVSNLIPGLVQVGNVANNAFQAAQTNGEVLYRAILPAGAKLSDSKEMGGAVRGLYHEANGIKGHANLIAVEAQKGTAVIANTVAAAMGIASMVVGQYYMTQINNELSEINDNIAKISDFQDNEYRSKVFSLMTHVKKIADFQSEILDNNELRTNNIAQLDSFEEECTQLLQQANLTLMGYTKKNDIDFNTYKEEIKEIQNWYSYQKSLIDILYKISELRYTLYIGSISREHSSALLTIYSQQVVETQKMLRNWHQTIAEKLNIDMNGTRRKRDGVDGLIRYIPGLIRSELNFQEIDKDTINLIVNQVSGYSNNYHQERSELYQENVQLISKNGKVYYLPEV